MQKRKFNVAEEEQKESHMIDQQIERIAQEVHDKSEGVDESIEVTIASEFQKDEHPKHSARFEQQASPQEIKLRWWNWKYNAPGTSNFWAICPYVFFVCSVNQFDESVIPLALPLIQKELNISYADAQWLATSYYLGTAATSIPLSKLTSLVGVVTLTQILLVITGILYLAAFFISDFASLVIIRAFIGATTSGFLSTRNMFVSSYPSDEKRQAAVANTLMLRMVQQVIYPFIGQAIISSVGWRYVSLCPAILILLSIIFLIPFSQIPRSGRWSHFDYFGSISLATLLVSFALCFTFLTFQNWVIAGILSIVFVLGCIAFYFAEKYAKSPIMPLGLLKNPLVDVLFTNTMNFANTLSLQFLIPQILKHVGFEENLIGAMSSVGSAFGVASTLLNNFLTTKIVSRILIPAVYAILFVAMGIFAGVFEYKYGALIMFFIYIFFSIWVQQHTYGLLLTCVPRSLAQYVCGLPPLSRTFGSSLASCLNQSIFEILSILIKDEVSRFRYSVIVVVVFQMLLVILNFIVALIRYGNPENENHKKGFKEHRIRKLKYVDEVA